MGDTRAQPTTFLSLPAELRNRIYRLVFRCEFDTAYDPDQRFWYREYHCRCRGQALLRVSRQIRTDTIPIFYGIHEFNFNAYNRAFLESWLNAAALEAVASLQRMRFSGYMQGIKGWDPKASNLTVDLRGSEPVVECFAKGREPSCKGEEINGILSTAVKEILQSLERDGKGRCVLSKEKLGAIFDVLVIDEGCAQDLVSVYERYGIGSRSRSYCLLE